MALLAVAGGHGTQAKGEVEPAAGLYVPLPQRVHAAAPSAAAYEPATQLEQVAAAVAPMAALAVPKPQGVQETEPLVAAKVPVGQALHTLAPSLEKKPGAQGAQAAAEEAPVAVDAVPAGHWLQVGSPKPAWNWPGGHKAHVPLGSTKVPAAQVVQRVEPDTLKEPGAQHAPAPDVSANNPAPQEAHAMPPLTLENLPTGQAVQFEAATAPATNPTGQARQSVTELGVAEAVKVPGWHCRQALPPGSDHELGGQHVAAPGCEEVPPGQAVQERDALALENVPAGHCSHV